MPGRSINPRLFKERTERVLAAMKRMARLLPFEVKFETKRLRSKVTFSATVDLPHGRRVIEAVYPESYLITDAGRFDAEHPKFAARLMAEVVRIVAYKPGARDPELDAAWDLARGVFTRGDRSQIVETRRQRRLARERQKD